MTCSSAPCRWWNRWRSGPARRTAQAIAQPPPRGNPILGRPLPGVRTRRPSSPRAPSLRGFWTSAVWWTRPTHAQSAFSYQGRHYLQLSGQLEVQGEPLLLNVAYDILLRLPDPAATAKQAHGRIFLPSVCRLLRGFSMPLPGSSPGRWTSSPTRPSGWRPETCPAGRGESPRPMRSAPWPGV